MFDWRWDFTFEILPALAWATLNTLLAAGIGYLIALALGLVFALAQRTPWRLLTWTVREAVEFIRSTPLVLQIFFVFYVGPQFGIRLSPWTSGMIAIGLHYAAYLSEVYRAGLDGVPRGQWEACRALNLSVRRTWTDITGLVDLVRQVKSPEEQALLRRAAAVTGAATAAATVAVRDGASEREIAAECLAAMTRAGGDPPGFGPFVRPKARLGEEHTTWGDGTVRRGETVFLEVAGCVARYHAPNGRLVHIGQMSEGDRAVAAIAKEAYAAVLDALRPGALARDVYAAWQRAVDAAGLTDYRRHHCGYAVGIAFPPSWTGGNRVVGLRNDSDMEIREGMSFHIMSWLMGCRLGDFFLSNTVLLTPAGPEELTGSGSAICGT